MIDRNWSGRLSFIITASAFAVGLGNIWRFPYIAGEGGGGAFLLVYIILVFLIGIPIMVIEIALGRMSKATPLLGYGRLSKHPSWNGIGWLGVLASLLIMSYYIIIMTWIVVYVWESISGNISLVEVGVLPEYFDTISSNMPAIIIVDFAILLFAILIIGRGLKAGLERYSRIMMIGLVLLLIGLVIWGSTLEGALEGYKWFLYPDLSKINMHVVASALGQLFFSIGVGMSIAFVFGSYTSRKENLIRSTAWIVFADTFFAIMAGLLVFPVIFTYGLAPDSGPDLIFVTMASAFNNMQYGAWLGGLFFIFLFLAGFTSLISTIQGIKDSLQDKFDLPDKLAILLTSGAILMISIPVAFSYVTDPVTLFGKHFFALLDYLTSTIMLPLGGLLTAVFAAHIIGFDRIKSHIMIGSDGIIISHFWKFVIRWIVPSAILVILLNGII